MCKKELDPGQSTYSSAEQLRRRRMCARLSGHFNELGSGIVHVDVRAAATIVASWAISTFTAFSGGTQPSVEELGGRVGIPDRIAPIASSGRQAGRFRADFEERYPRYRRESFAPVSIRTAGRR